MNNHFRNTANCSGQDRFLKNQRVCNDQWPALRLRRHNEEICIFNVRIRIEKRSKKYKRRRNIQLHGEVSQIFHFFAIANDKDFMRETVFYKLRMNFYQFSIAFSGMQSAYRDKNGIRSLKIGNKFYCFFLYFFDRNCIQNDLICRKLQVRVGADQNIFRLL